MNAVDTYDSNATDMIESALDGTSSNFNETSEWFLGISADYEALSSFDKENVYCDVVAIQSNPDAILLDAEFEFSCAQSLVMISVVGLLYVTGVFFCKKYNKFYGVDMNDI